MRLMFFLLLITPLLVLAADEDLYKNYEGGAADISDQIEEWEFQEDVHVLPDYPDRGLLEVEIDSADPRFEYYIDPKALTIGIDDVIRYTIVVRSSTGFENVFYEALNCSQREYKTYAYGGAKKEFVEMQDPGWRYVNKKTEGGGTNYRYDFLTFYLCDKNRMPLSKDKMLLRIKNPGETVNEKNSFL